MKMRAQQEPWMIAGLVLLFGVLGIAGVFRHEVWLDEAHHWLLARDSASFSDLVYNARYEGHPLLWNFMLFVLSRFTANVAAMQVLHVLLATGSVFVILRFAPFRFWWRVLLVFGYFFFYEYNIISRNYALAGLLLGLCCILYVQRKRFLLFCFLLGLLANTHLFGTAIAGALLVTALLEKRFAGQGQRISGAGLLLFVLLLIPVLLVVVVPSDHFLFDYDPDPMFSAKRFGKGGSVLWKGLIPFPDFSSDHPWNSYAIIAASKKWSTPVIALIWILPAFLLTRRWTVLVYFYVTAFCIALFVYFSPLIVGIRHCGFLWLLFVSALWIQEADATTRSIFPAKFLPRAERFRNIFLPVLLLVHVIAGVGLYLIDWNRPFSQMKAAASWLQKNRPQQELIVDVQTIGPPLSAELQKSLYYPVIQTKGSFARWNARPYMIPADTLLVRTQRYVVTLPQHEATMVLSKPLDAAALTLAAKLGLQITNVASFTGGMVRPEDNYIYDVKTHP